AREYGVAHQAVDDMNELYAKYGLTASQVREVGSDWLDDVADFLRLPITSVFLVMIGITCLILELKMPGVGLPGILAAVCFVLFFWSQSQFGGQVTMLAILLFVLGLILLGLEIFVLPGFGVAGISGIVLTIGSLGLVAYGEWPQTTQQWVGFGKAMTPFGL